LPPKRQAVHFELVLKVVSLPKKGDGFFKAPRPEGHEVSAYSHC
jgi:hypothetical protein